MAGPAREIGLRDSQATQPAVTPQSPSEAKASYATATRSSALNASGSPVSGRVMLLVLSILTSLHEKDVS